MDLHRAKELLYTLADGVNPLTGEILPETDSCNQVEIVRALHKVLRVLDETDAKQKSPAGNAGKPWTAEDDAALCRMFDAGSTCQDMQAYFQRTRSSIETRLVRVGKIQRRSDFRGK